MAVNRRDIPAIKTMEELLRRYDLSSIENIRQNPMMNAQEIGDGANLNDYTAPGFYYCERNVTAQTILNTPADWAFSLAVEHHAENGACKQTFSTYLPTQNINSRVYRRNYYNNTWGAWSWIVENKDLLDLTYPIGAIYLSVTSTSPATLFGGTWIQLQDRFLLGAGSTYINGNTGGEATHALSEAEMPVHDHSASSNSTGAHTHPIRYKALTANDGSYVCLRRTDSGDSYDGTDSDAANSAGSHSHTITIGSAGSGSAHNTMPPYLVVYMWKRTA